tara:strand:- start:5129 stop:5827 length:699 start_codon:yes stop_codon:yes gene_type:complete
MKKQPIIGVTRSASRDYAMYFAIKMAMWLEGCQVVLITAKTTPQDLALDGLILSGGVDILLGHDSSHKKANYPYEPERDTLEYMQLKRAEEMRIPVLGICRGAQIINIHRGGTLHYDVAKAYEKAQYPSSLLAKLFYRKRMHTDNESLIDNIIGDNIVKINSIHTQAIDKLGTGLRITAKESNGVVQVIEDPSFDFYLGLQFHPELLLYHRYFRQIFSAFKKSVVLRKESSS